MAKPIPLFKRDEPAVPLAPMVAEEIAAAENELAALEAGRGDAALSAMSEGGDVNAIAKLNSEATNIRVRIFNLQAAHRTASERDERRAAEERHQQSLEALAAFTAACGQRDSAVARYCDAIHLAAAALSDIHEFSTAIEILIPAGTQLPRGHSVYNAELLVEGGGPQVAPISHVAAFEMARHSRPGQGPTLPGARNFSLSTSSNTGAVESWADASKRTSEFLVEAIANQIERAREIEIASIDAMKSEGAHV
jgi:hypothetical protein